MKIAVLKPINESIQETTISYERLALDLTAVLAKKEQVSMLRLSFISLFLKILIISINMKIVLKWNVEY